MENPSSRLDRCLARFGAKSLKTDLTEVYPAASYSMEKIGQPGAYGVAYKIRNVTTSGSRTASVVVSKEIEKSKLIHGGQKAIERLSCELFMTQGFSSPYLNSRVGLYHSESRIYLVLQTLEPPIPDLKTRLYHLFSKHCRALLPTVPQRLAEAERVGKSPETVMAEAAKSITEMTYCLLPREVLSCGALFDIICAQGKFPPGKALVVLKQLLLGLAFLHKNNIVHRDIKTENIIYSEERNCVEKLDSTGTKVIGVRITEKILVNIIDFGMVKFMQVKIPPSPAPGNFSAWANAATLPAAVSTDDKFPKLISTPTIIQCSPDVGSYCYQPREIVNGVLEGKASIDSTIRLLPKFDVFGAGTVLYCMLNERVSFYVKRHDKYGNLLEKDVRLKKISELMDKGAVFVDTVPEALKEFALRLMCDALVPVNVDHAELLERRGRLTLQVQSLEALLDILNRGGAEGHAAAAASATVAQLGDLQADLSTAVEELKEKFPVPVRPTAAEALEDPLLQGITDEFTYDVLYPAEQWTDVVTKEESVDQDDLHAAQAIERATIAEVMEIARGKEDNGDGAGKEVVNEDE